jgi:excisionase family DNA binding protein
MVAEKRKDHKSEFLTARQLAGYLQVSESTVHRLRRSGRIPSVKLTDRLFRFNLRDVRNALTPYKRRDEHSADAASPDSGPNPQLSFDEKYPEFKPEE